MNKPGVVTALQNDVAVVRLTRHSACGDCGACGHGDAESKDMLVEAVNEAGASVGDQVLVDLESVEVVRAAFIFYAIPLVALLIGVFAGKAGAEALALGGNSDLWAAAIGTLLMVGAFIGIRLNEKRLKGSGRYLSKVVEICRTQNGNQ